MILLVFQLSTKKFVFFVYFDLRHLWEPKGQGWLDCWPPNMLDSYHFCLSFLKVKHFLQHTFGVPYAENYYAGDWMLGPDLFCWQPICSLAWDINAFAYHVKPKTYDDVQLVINTIRKHKTPIDRYRYLI